MLLVLKCLPPIGRVFLLVSKWMTTVSDVLIHVVSYQHPECDLIMYYTTILDFLMKMFYSFLKMLTHNCNLVGT